jgi:hypothetical protein
MPTYIYEDAKRNFIIGRDIPNRLSKAEHWRLGNERSEDALSWNVFVSLYVLGGLTEAVKLLTGRDTAKEPELHLWGNRIDAHCVRWEPLLDVRHVLENGLAIKTEPDVILRIPGQAIVLIEAKFGSENGRLAKSEERFGSVTKFLARYRCKNGAADPLNRKWISEQPSKSVMEQLCRNVIFAHWLASEEEQPFVINLVRRDAANEEQLFREHLSESGVAFHVRRWEDVFALPVVQTEQASTLRTYVKNKTLKLSPAFHF